MTGQLIKVIARTVVSTDQHGSTKDRYKSQESASRSELEGKEMGACLLTSVA